MHLGQRNPLTAAMSSEIWLKTSVAIIITGILSSIFFNANDCLQFFYTYDIIQNKREGFFHEKIVWDFWFNRVAVFV